MFEGSSSFDAVDRVLGDSHQHIAQGFRSFSLAVSSSVYVAAARSPPESTATNNKSEPLQLLKRAYGRGHIGSFGLPATSDLTFK